jgi:hypothetical protein
MGYLKYTDTARDGSPNPIVGTARYGRVRTVTAKYAYSTFNTTALLGGIYIPAGSAVIGAIVSIDTAFTGTAGDKFGLKLGSTSGTELIANTVTTLANLSDDAVLGNFIAFAKAKTDQQIYMTFSGTAFTAGSATVTIFFVPNDRT